MQCQYSWNSFIRSNKLSADLLLTVGHLPRDQPRLNRGSLRTTKNRQMVIVQPLGNSLGCEIPGG